MRPLHLRVCPSGAIRERHLRATARVHFYTVDGKGCVFNLLESDLRFIHQ